MGRSPLTSRPTRAPARPSRRPGQAVEAGKAVEKAKPGAPHVLVIRTPDERLVWLSGLHSRRHADVTAFLRAYTGFLIVDGFRGYQTLLTCEKPVLAGIQQCCQHIARRGKGVGKLGPGSLQSWAKKVTDVLNRGAHRGRGGQGPRPDRPGPEAAGRSAGPLRRRGRVRDHPQPPPALGRRRQPPRLQAGRPG